MNIRSFHKIGYQLQKTLCQNDDAVDTFLEKQRLNTYINRITSFTTILEHNRIGIYCG